MHTIETEDATARPVNDALGFLVAELVDGDGLGAPSVSQCPPAPARPGPFKVDMRPLAPKQARDREWLRETAKRLVAVPGIAGAVAVPPSIYVRPDHRWLRAHVVPRVLAAGDRYGFAEPGSGQVVHMKFSNPNANKALHIGHLRTNFLGMSISLLLESQGWSVDRISVLSDWGIHICQAAVGWTRWGDDATPSSVGVKGDHFVADFYVRFHQASSDKEALDEEAVELLRRCHAGEPAACELVRQITDWCEDGINATYARIGTRLAAAPRESSALDVGVRAVMRAADAGRLQRRSDGSVFMPVPGSDDGELTLIRSDGTPVVYTQWLGVDIERHSGRSLDGDVVLFGDQWESGAAMYCALLEAVGLDWPQDNITHGMVVTPAGAMSSRQGSGVRADDALNHFYHCFIELLRAEGRPVNTQLSEACEQLGIGFLKYALLRKPRKRAVEYDEQALWEQQRRAFCQLVKTVVDVESDGPSVGPVVAAGDGNGDGHGADALSEALLAMNAFPDVVARAANERDPAGVVRGLEELSASVGKADRLGSLDAGSRAAARVVFRQGFKLLNIDIGRAVEILAADGGSMTVPADTSSAARRLVGLAPAKPAAYIRSQAERLDRHEADFTAGVVAAVSMEADRLVQAACDPPRLAIPSSTINAFGERCFEIDALLEGEVVAMLARHGGVRQVLSEESGVIPLADSGCTVVLDPIDGTKNYKMGLSYYAMSMAVVSDEGVVSGGLVMNLATGTQYAAIRGRGAFRNGRAITAGAPKSLGAVDVIYVGLSRSAAELQALGGIAAQVSSFRAMGCAALDLCCLATGNVGLFVDLSNTAKTVDVLAAALIAEEAGALVTSLEGRPILDGVSVDTIYDWRFRTLGAATADLHAFGLEQCAGLT